MKTTSLHKLLTDLIKKHGKVTYREMEGYCEQNGYYAYTGIRRLQEVRQPLHRNYDPDLRTGQKLNNLIPDSHIEVLKVCH